MRMSGLGSGLPLRGRGSSAGYVAGAATVGSVRGADRNRDEREADGDLATAIAELKTRDDEGTVLSTAALTSPSR
jgi:hypothetical protein